MIDIIIILEHYIDIETTILKGAQFRNVHRNWDEYLIKTRTAICQDYTQFLLITVHSDWHNYLISTGTVSTEKLV